MLFSPVGGAGIVTPNPTRRLTLVKGRDNVYRPTTQSAADSLIIDLTVDGRATAPQGTILETDIVAQKGRPQNDQGVLIIELTVDG